MIHHLRVSLAVALLIVSTHRASAGPDQNPAKYPAAKESPNNSIKQSDRGWPL
jgi:hypothetical protein